MRVCRQRIQSWGVLSGIVALFLATVLPATAPSVQAAPEDEYHELMKLFVDAFEEIDRNYVTQVDRRELVEAAMRGMLIKLDPYSSYIDQEDFREFNEQVEQEFGGVGIQVTLDPKSRQLMVMTPLPGTPAYQAGIKAGDRILEIDGQKTAEFPEGQEMENAVKLMRGKPGDSVKVKVGRQGTDEPIEVAIVRAVIKTPTVLGDHYEAGGEWSYFLPGDQKIGYIRLTHFSRNSAEELEAALQKLTKDGMKGLILDLRFNPGGLLTAATEIADLFVEDGVIVSTKGRNTDEQVIKARKPGTYVGFPMVVLVNRYSASASEIVSACLQDHQRAIVVGERTWGKGSVQNVINLDGGKSALKLTTASYHRPSGKNIHRFPNSKEEDEWGVMPNDGYLLKYSPSEMEQYLDYRRDRDVIREGDAKGAIDFEDKQLAKGVAYLTEQLAAPPTQKPADVDANKGEKKDEKAGEAPKGGASIEFYRRIPWRPGRSG